MDLDAHQEIERRWSLAVSVTIQGFPDRSFRVLPFLTIQTLGGEL
jgi:hypothetical protein